jgi:hypothetical protein
LQRSALEDESTLIILKYQELLPGLVFTAALL